MKPKHTKNVSNEIYKTQQTYKDLGIETKSSNYSMYMQEFQVHLVKIIFHFVSTFAHGHKTHNGLKNLKALEAM
jgi:hypothetical protein